MATNSESSPRKDHEEVTASGRGAQAANLGEEAQGHDAARPGAAAGVQRRVRRRLARWGLLVLGALVTTLMARTTMFTSHQVQVAPVTDLVIDGAKTADHLARAITFQTISLQDASQTDAGAFLALHRALVEMYPRVHVTLEREVVGERSLLYSFKGREPSLQPILLLAHMDVVPVEPGTEREWERPPFAGAIADGFVWGRGAMDFKLGVIGLLDAVELLLEKGFQPRRTLYLAFGHDEEIGGPQGARAIAELLRSRGVTAEYALDEGMMITEGIVPGVAAPAALIGIAEKGSADIELVVEGQGGHSSMPPRRTPVGRLGAAIHRLEEHPMSGGIQGPAQQLFEALGPEMSFGQRLTFANLWLFGGLVEWQLSSNPSTDAMLRTTTAPTIIEGSVKQNVLPRRARAIVNFRLLPGDSVESLVEHVKKVVDDPEVQIRVLEGAKGSSPVARTTAPGYQSIERTIRQIFPTAVVAPSLFLGATDSRHYEGIAREIYRFSPQRIGPQDRARFHGLNERIFVKDLAESVRFYAQLIRASDSL